MLKVPIKNPIKVNHKIEKKNKFLPWSNTLTLKKKRAIAITNFKSLINNKITNLLSTSVIGDADEATMLVAVEDVNGARIAVADDDVIADTEGNVVVDDDVAAGVDWVDCWDVAASDDA